MNLDDMDVILSAEYIKPLSKLAAKILCWSLVDFLRYHYIFSLPVKKDDFVKTDFRNM